MAEVNYNFYAPIINNGTLNGDIYNPTYNCNGEVPEENFDANDMFNGNMGGIGDRSQFWIFLVAACARGAQFDNIPKFVDKAFEKFNIGLDKEDCKKSTQDILKSQPWQAIKSNTDMIKFISELRCQPNKKAEDLSIANNIFIALKDFDWG